MSDLEEQQSPGVGNNFLPNEASEDDTIKILLSTDNHVGFNEKDKVRGMDSVITFEEVLSLAQKHDVDMILLGGDLFHENKPSRTMMHAVINLLRKYTMGDKPSQLEFLSDPSINFKHNKFTVVNYEDPNLNIAYPVFSIHGNHDDPSSNNLCALDVLSSMGLVNYFGKCDTLDRVEVSPLLFKKGETKLALYGLGCIRDERLHRLFEQQKVAILKPRDDPASWFNLFAIHQNRAKHSQKDYIPESFLGDFLDFVLWGHEHDCRVDPEFNGKFWVSQPGSSVATSLSEGESKQKHVALLSVNKKSFRLEKLPLQSVRPFLFEDINLKSTDIKPDDLCRDKKVLDYCKERVQALIEVAQQTQAAHSSKRTYTPLLPLVRLRVDYTGGFDTFNSIQFGQQFVDRVANPKDIVLFTKKRQAREKGEILHLDDVDAHISELSHITIEEIVNGYLGAIGAKGSLKMDVLSERGMGKAVGEFVMKDDGQAIWNMVEHQVKNVSKSLNQSGIERDGDIADYLKRLKDERSKKSSSEIDSEFSKVIEESQRSRVYVPPSDIQDSDNEHEPRGLLAAAANTSSARGRGSRGGRGSRRGRGSHGEGTKSSTRGRGRGKGILVKNSHSNALNYDSDDDISVIPATQSGRSSGSSSKPPTKKQKGIVVEDDDDEDNYLPGKRTYQ